ncbi:hypothetical protein [Actinacidiphila glaucinigra]|uniref:hypothetical protein n=1 Tax=Actinacidiphila glaucinigra TaxID=235986 RepID=UPI0036706F9F
MSGLVATGAQRLLAVAHWMGAAALDPGRARQEWAEFGMTLLECGTLFSAVRMPGDMVHAAAQSRDPRAMGAFLAGALDGGPVIVDPVSERYYALVPASVALRWDVAGTLCLGRNSCVGVPYPDRTEPRVGRPFWSVAVDSPGILCVPGDVALVARAGRSRLAVEGTQA